MVLLNHSGTRLSKYIKDLKRHIILPNSISITLQPNISGTMYSPSILHLNWLKGVQCLCLGSTVIYALFNPLGDEVQENLHSISSQGKEMSNVVHIAKISFQD